MIKEISKDIIYVTGASCSAIYNFNTEKVFSVNQEGTKILSKAITGHTLLSELEKNYLLQVKTLLHIPQDVDFTHNDLIFPQVKPQLSFAWLEVTQKCNSLCIHCYEGQAHHEVATPLSNQEWYQTIDALASMNCKTIQFIGGEPTLHPELANFIRYANSKGFERILLFSNLYHLSAELKNVIIKHHVQVRFSIYGASSETHDRITQIKGSFSHLTENITFLQEKHVPLQGCIVIMKENESERSTIHQFLTNLGITNIKYDEIRKVYGGCQSSHLVSDSKVMIKIPNFRAKKEHFFHAGLQNTCWYGKIVISTDGCVFPCEFERNIIYGNIRNNNIYDIIHSDTIQKYWYLSFNNVKECKDCEYRFACKDCRPMAFAENGNLFDKNPRCTYNPYSGNWN